MYSLSDSMEFPDSHHSSQLLFLPAGFLDCIQCPHRADVYKSLQVDLSPCEFRSRVHPYFISRVKHVLFFLLGWFLGWGINDRTDAVEWGLYIYIYIIWSVTIESLYCCQTFEEFYWFIYLRVSNNLYVFIPTKLEGEANNSFGYLAHHWINIFLPRVS